jgi:hypothetical protein
VPGVLNPPEHGHVHWRQHRRHDARFIRRRDARAQRHQDCNDEDNTQRPLLSMRARKIFGTDTTDLLQYHVVPPGVGEIETARLDGPSPFAELRATGSAARSRNGRRPSTSSG